MLPVEGYDSRFPENQPCLYRLTYLLLIEQAWNKNQLMKEYSAEGVHLVDEGLKNIQLKEYPSLTKVFCFL